MEQNAIYVCGDTNWHCTQWHTHRVTRSVPYRGVVVLERGGTPFRQIFLSWNGVPVNIAYHSRNADTAAVQQICSYYMKVYLYTKFGQLVLRKIIEIVATRCHTLRLKCTKFDFGLQRFPRPPSWFKGPTSKGQEGKGSGERGLGRRGGREG